MDREYLLKVINKNFFLLNRDEIANAAKNNWIFRKQTTFLQFLQNQDSRLSDPESLRLFSPYFHSIVEEVSASIQRGRLNPITEIGYADTSLLILSAYNEYPAICSDSIMFAFIRLVLKEKILLV